MTTIAYRDGVMASDSMASSSNDVHYDIRKVFRTKNYLLGFCGTYSLLRPMYQWISDLDDEDVSPNAFHKHVDDLSGAPDQSTAVLLAGREGDLWDVYSDGGVFKSTRGWGSIGSGSSYALASLKLGYQVKKAVKTAMYFDPYTAGEIQTISFDQKIISPE